MLEDLGVVVDTAHHSEILMVIYADVECLVVERDLSQLLFAHRCLGPVDYKVMLV